ncbi:putative uridine monophosphate kinase [Obelidium mucronatum]|nr:putative uridine monophosphate kinase [Obelidium mucronatum]
MFSICIAGGASSGKKAVCELIIQRLKDGLVDHSSKVAVIKLEDFYRDLTGEERKLLDQGLYNFDHPNALDFDLLHSVLESLSQGTPCILPKWDFQLFKRIPSSTELSSPDVCIVVGNLALYSKPIRESFHLKVFVDVDSDLRLAKQVLRDTEERYQLPLDKVLDDYLNFVKPAFEDFILPTKKACQCDYSSWIRKQGCDWSSCYAYCGYSQGKSGHKRVIDRIPTRCPSNNARAIK